MNRCKNDTETNCLKIISSHLCQNKRNAPSIHERNNPCSNEKTFVKPTDFCANKIESSRRTHKVKKTTHNCSVKQPRPLRHQPRIKKCRKRKRTSKNTVLRFILRKFLYWCPCFCRCKTKSRRILSPDICVNSCPCDEKLLNQLWFSCSDKGLKASTENLKTIKNTRQKLNNESGKTKASSLKPKLENRYNKIMFNDKIAKEELISPKNETKCKNDRTAVNRFVKQEELNFESTKCRHDSRKSFEITKNKIYDCKCGANQKQYAGCLSSQPFKPMPEKGFVFLRKHDNIQYETAIDGN